MSWGMNISGYGGAAARAKPKFKIGDIVVNKCGDRHAFTGEFFLRFPKMLEDKSPPELFELYDGPIYEKGGQRFVISGEVRPPQNGEWYTHDVSGAGITQAECAPYDNSDCVIILLLVPEVEPEFKVGDYIKHKVTGEVLPYKDDYYQFAPENWEKHNDPFLDGTREITDEDLVHQSGVIVRCRLCSCASLGGGYGEGEIFAGNDILGNAHYFHGGQDNFRDTRFAFAVIEDSGKVTWHDMAKENIRVVL